MSSRVEFPFVIEMQNEDTVGGRLAKLPFGIIFIIIFTGALSYYFERNQPVDMQVSTPTAQEMIQRTIVQRKSGNTQPLPLLINPPMGRWYLYGTAAVTMPGLAGVFVFRAVRRRRFGQKQRRSRN